MHAFILIVTVFLTAQNGVPEHAVAKAIVVPTAQACMEGGGALVAQLNADPRVSIANFDCLETTNPKDKAA